MASALQERFVRHGAGSATELARAVNPRDYLAARVVGTDHVSLFG